jgi:mRNA interferase RelE/StbE
LNSSDANGHERVLFRPQAVRDLERLPNRNRDQVEGAIERFAQTGFGDIMMLAGEGRQFRLRVGDWRVRFVYEKPDIIRILHIRNRREAYR